MTWGGRANFRSEDPLPILEHRLPCHRLPSARSRDAAADASINGAVLLVGLCYSSAGMAVEYDEIGIWSEVKLAIILGGHPKPAINRHLKTGN